MNSISTSPLYGSSKECVGKRTGLMGAVRPQTPHRSPRQAFGGNFQYGLPAASAGKRWKTTHLNFFLA
jgi:hypothetical protein